MIFPSAEIGDFVKLKSMCVRYSPNNGHVTLCDYDFALILSLRYRDPLPDGKRGLYETTPNYTILTKAGFLRECAYFDIDEIIQKRNDND